MLMLVAVVLIALEIDSIYMYVAMYEKNGTNVVFYAAVIRPTSMYRNVIAIGCH